MHWRLRGLIHARPLGRLISSLLLHLLMLLQGEDLLLGQLLGLRRDTLLPLRVHCARACLVLMVLLSPLRDLLVALRMLYLLRVACRWVALRPLGMPLLALVRALLLGVGTLRVARETLQDAAHVSTES